MNIFFGVFVLVGLFVGSVAKGDACGCVYGPCPPCPANGSTTTTIPGPRPIVASIPTPTPIPRIPYVVCWSQSLVAAGFSNVPEGSAGSSVNSSNRVVSLHLSTARVNDVDYTFPGHAGSGQSLDAAKTAAQTACSAVGVHVGTAAVRLANCRVINCIGTP